MLDQFVRVLDQALSILGIEGKAEREQMVTDVVVFLLATVLAKVSQQYLSLSSKQRLSEMMRGSPNLDRAELKRHWQAAMRVISDDVSNTQGLKQGVTKTIQEALGGAMKDYLSAITANATKEQKQKLAELLEEQSRTSRTA